MLPGQLLPQGRCLKADVNDADGVHAKLCLLENGNLELFEEFDDHHLKYWSSNSMQAAVADQSGPFALMFTTSGDLLLLDAGSGHSGDTVNALQAAAESESIAEIWTRSASVVGEIQALRLTREGNVVILDSRNRAVWETRTKIEAQWAIILKSYGWCQVGKPSQGGAIGDRLVDIILSTDSEKARAIRAEIGMVTYPFHNNLCTVASMGGWERYERFRRANTQDFWSTHWMVPALRSVGVQFCGEGDLSFCKDVPDGADSIRPGEALREGHAIQRRITTKTVFGGVNQGLSNFLTPLKESIHGKDERASRQGIPYINSVDSRLEMQTDGNLVLSFRQAECKAQFAKESGTDGIELDGGYANCDDEEVECKCGDESVDVHAALDTAEWKVVWATNTDIETEEDLQGPFALVMTTAGDLTLVDGAGTVAWRQDTGDASPIVCATVVGIRRLPTMSSFGDKTPSADDLLLNFNVYRADTRYPTDACSQEAAPQTTMADPNLVWSTITAPLSKVNTSPRGPDGATLITWRSRTDNPGRPACSLMTLDQCTDVPMGSDEMLPGQVLREGRSLEVPLGRLTMQDDGNLVLTLGRDTVIWESFTHAGAFHEDTADVKARKAQQKGPYAFVMTSMAELMIIDGLGQILWFVDGPKTYNVHIKPDRGLGAEKLMSPTSLIIDTIENGIFSGYVSPAAVIVAASPSQNFPAWRFRLQEDGNAVLLGGGFEPMFVTNTGDWHKNDDEWPMAILSDYTLYGGGMVRCNPANDQTFFEWAKMLKQCSVELVGDIALAVLTAGISSPGTVAKWAGKLTAAVAKYTTKEFAIHSLETVAKSTIKISKSIAMAAAKVAMSPVTFVKYAARVGVVGMAKDVGALFMLVLRKSGQVVESVGIMAGKAVYTTGKALLSGSIALAKALAKGARALWNMGIGKITMAVLEGGFKIGRFAVLGAEFVLKDILLAGPTALYRFGASFKSFLKVGGTHAAAELLAETTKSGVLDAVIHHGADAVAPGESSLGAVAAEAAAEAAEAATKRSTSEIGELASEGAVAASHRASVQQFNEAIDIAVRKEISSDHLVADSSIDYLVEQATDRTWVFEVADNAAIEVQEVGKVQKSGGSSSLKPIDEPRAIDPIPDRQSVAGLDAASFERQLSVPGGQAVDMGPIVDDLAAQLTASKQAIKDIDSFAFRSIENLPAQEVAKQRAFAKKVLETNADLVRYDALVKYGEEAAAKGLDADAALLKAADMTLEQAKRAKEANELAMVWSMHGTSGDTQSMLGEVLTMDGAVEGRTFPMKLAGAVDSKGDAAMMKVRSALDRMGKEPLPEFHPKRMADLQQASTLAKSPKGELAEAFEQANLILKLRFEELDARAALGAAQLAESSGVDPSALLRLASDSGDMAGLTDKIAAIEKQINRESLDLITYKIGQLGAGNKGWKKELVESFVNMNFEKAERGSPDAQYLRAMAEEARLHNSGSIDASLVLDGPIKGNNKVVVDDYFYGKAADGPVGQIDGIAGNSDIAAKQAASKQAIKDIDSFAFKSIENMPAQELAKQRAFAKKVLETNADLVRYDALVKYGEEAAAKGLDADAALLKAADMTLEQAKRAKEANELAMVWSMHGTSGDTQSMLGEVLTMDGAVEGRTLPMKLAGAVDSKGDAAMMKVRSALDRMGKEPLPEFHPKRMADLQQASTLAKSPKGKLAEAYEQANLILKLRFEELDARAALGAAQLAESSGVDPSALLRLASDSGDMAGLTNKIAAIERDIAGESKDLLTYKLGVLNKNPTEKEVQQKVMSRFGKKKHTADADFLHAMAQEARLHDAGGAVDPAIIVDGPMKDYRKLVVDDHIPSTAADGGGDIKQIGKEADGVPGDKADLVDGDVGHAKLEPDGRQIHFAGGAGPEIDVPIDALVDDVGTCRAKAARMRCVFDASEGEGKGDFFDMANGKKRLVAQQEQRVKLDQYLRIQQADSKANRLWQTIRMKQNAVGATTDRLHYIQDCADQAVKMGGDRDAFLRKYFRMTSESLDSQVATFDTAAFMGTHAQKDLFPVGSVDTYWSNLNDLHTDWLMRFKMSEDTVSKLESHMLGLSPPDLALRDFAAASRSIADPLDSEFYRLTAELAQAESQCSTLLLAETAIRAAEDVGADSNYIAQHVVLTQQSPGDISKARKAMEKVNQRLRDDWVELLRETSNAEIAEISERTGLNMVGAVDSIEDAIKEAASKSVPHDAPADGFDIVSVMQDVFDNGPADPPVGALSAEELEAAKKMTSVEEGDQVLYFKRDADGDVVLDKEKSQLGWEEPTRPRSYSETLPELNEMDGGADSAASSGETVIEKMSDVDSSFWSDPASDQQVAELSADADVRPSLDDIDIRERSKSEVVTSKSDLESGTEAPGKDSKVPDEGSSKGGSDLGSHPDAAGVDMGQASVATPDEIAAQLAASKQAIKDIDSFAFKSIKRMPGQTLTSERAIAKKVLETNADLVRYDALVKYGEEAAAKGLDADAALLKAADMTLEQAKRAKEANELAMVWSMHGTSGDTQSMLREVLDGPYAARADGATFPMQLASCMEPLDSTSEAMVAGLREMRGEPLPKYHPARMQYLREASQYAMDPHGELMPLFVQANMVNGLRQEMLQLEAAYGVATLAQKAGVDNSVLLRIVSDSGDLSGLSEKIAQVNRQIRKESEILVLHKVEVFGTRTRESVLSAAENTLNLHSASVTPEDRSYILAMLDEAWLHKSEPNAAELTIDRSMPKQRAKMDTVYMHNGERVKVKIQDDYIGTGENVDSTPGSKAGGQEHPDTDLHHQQSNLQSDKVADIPVDPSTNQELVAWQAANKQAIKDIDSFTFRSIENMPAQELAKQRAFAKKVLETNADLVRYDALVKYGEEAAAKGLDADAALLKAADMTLEQAKRAKEANELAMVWSMHGTSGDTQSMLGEVLTMDGAVEGRTFPVKLAGAVDSKGDAAMMKVRSALDRMGKEPLPEFHPKRMADLQQASTLAKSPKDELAEASKQADHLIRLMKSQRAEAFEQANLILKLRFEELDARAALWAAQLAESSGVDPSALLRLASDSGDMAGLTNKIAAIEKQISGDSYGLLVKKLRVIERMTFKDVTEAEVQQAVDILFEKAERGSPDAQYLHAMAQEARLHNIGSTDASLVLDDPMKDGIDLSSGIDGASGKPGDAKIQEDYFGSGGHDAEVEPNVGPDAGKNPTDHGGDTTAGQPQDTPMDPDRDGQPIVTEPRPDESLLDGVDPLSGSDGASGKPGDAKIQEDYFGSGGHDAEVEPNVGPDAGKNPADHGGETIGGDTSQDTPLYPPLDPPPIYEPLPEPQLDGVDPLSGSDGASGKPGDAKIQEDYFGSGGHDAEVEPNVGPDAGKNPTDHGGDTTAGQPQETPMDPDRDGQPIVTEPRPDESLLDGVDPLSGSDGASGKPGDAKIQEDYFGSGGHDAEVEPNVGPDAGKNPTDHGGDTTAGQPQETPMDPDRDGQPIVTEPRPDESLLDGVDPLSGSDGASGKPGDAKIQEDYFGSGGHDAEVEPNVGPDAGKNPANHGGDKIDYEYYNPEDPANHGGDKIDYEYYNPEDPANRGGDKIEHVQPENAPSGPAQLQAERAAEAWFPARQHMQDLPMSIEVDGRAVDISALSRKINKRLESTRSGLISIKKDLLDGALPKEALASITANGYSSVLDKSAEMMLKFRKNEAIWDVAVGLLKRGESRESVEAAVQATFGVSVKEANIARKELRLAMAVTAFAPTGSPTAASRGILDQVGFQSSAGFQASFSKYFKNPGKAEAASLRLRQLVAEARPGTVQTFDRATLSKFVATTEGQAEFQYSLALEMAKYRALEPDPSYVKGLLKLAEETNANPTALLENTVSLPKGAVSFGEGVINPEYRKLQDIYGPSSQLIKDDAKKLLKPKEQQLVDALQSSPPIMKQQASLDQMSRLQQAFERGVAGREEKAYRKTMLDLERELKRIGADGKKNSQKVPKKNAAQNSMSFIQLAAAIDTNASPVTLQDKADLSRCRNTQLQDCDIGTTGDREIRLTPGQGLSSPFALTRHGIFSGGLHFLNLRMQSDGNLVLQDGDRILWDICDGGRQCSTDGVDEQHTLLLDGKGDLMVLGSDPTDVKWIVGASNKGPVRDLVIQEDGNLVIYRQTGEAIWTSVTAGFLRSPNMRVGEWDRSLNYLQYSQGDVICSAIAVSFCEPALTRDDEIRSCMFRGERLDQDQFLRAPGGDAFLTMQGDGNLVLYHHGKSVWESGTDGDGEGPFAAILDIKGSFQVVDRNKNVQWRSDRDMKYAVVNVQVGPERAEFLGYDGVSGPKVVND